MLYVKRMELVNVGFRDNVDLRIYDHVIKNCFLYVLPRAQVLVYRHFYEIQTKKDMTPTDARLIGRKMGKTQFSRFLVEHFYDGGILDVRGKSLRN